MTQRRRKAETLLLERAGVLAFAVFPAVVSAAPAGPAIPCATRTGTRAQVLRWQPDGTPDFGVPVPDGPLPMPLAAKPLFRQPIHDGAADPVVVWNPQRRRW